MDIRQMASQSLEHFLGKRITVLSDTLQKLHDSDFLRKEQQIINHFILRVPHLNVKEARIRRNMEPDRTCNLVIDIHYEGSTELVGLEHWEIKSDHCYEEHIWSEHILRLHTKVEELSDEVKGHLKKKVLERMNSIKNMIDPVRWHNQRVEDTIERHRKTVELRSGIINDGQEKRGLFDFLFRKRKSGKTSERIMA